MSPSKPNESLNEQGFGLPGVAFLNFTEEPALADSLIFVNKLSLSILMMALAVGGGILIKCDCVFCIRGFSIDMDFFSIGEKVGDSAKVSFLSGSLTTGERGEFYISASILFFALSWATVFLYFALMSCIA
jgi:hypothetical protein